MMMNDYETMINNAKNEAETEKEKKLIGISIAILTRYNGPSNAILKTTFITKLSKNIWMC